MKGRNNSIQMAATHDETLRQTNVYQGDDARWEAVKARDAGADGQFWFSVASTGVYCYPSCAARRPLRNNVGFHGSREAAERAGYRPCKRCRPDLPPRRERHAAVVVRACRMIEEAEREPSLKELAAMAGLSPHHFQRHFKALAGVTPKQYAAAHRAQRLRGALSDSGSVTEAIHGAGYKTAARLYEQSAAVLGMAPRAFAKGGAGEHIRWDVTPSWLGPVLIAATERGICAILLGETEQALLADLTARFSRARLERAEEGSEFSVWLIRALELIGRPDRPVDLPLDVAGTIFQRRVWAALREVPPGETTTYRAVAERIGRPKAVRAVASACASNPVAVAIPCHRVLASDGSLRGYRWGTGIKRALLNKEAGK